MLQTQALHTKGAMSDEAALCEAAAVGSYDNEASDVNLHTVESISDIHWTSTHLEVPKGPEGNSHSQASTPRMPHNSAQEGIKILVDDKLETTSPDPTLADLINCLWPFSRPINWHMVLYTALAGLLFLCVVLMIYAVSLSVQHSESIQALSEQLASQEESIRQLRIASLQLLKKLNNS